MSEKNESFLTVPAELTRKCSGVCLDIGSSVMKIVYRSQEDLEEVKSEDTKYGRLHLVLFPRSQLTEALEYVRQRAVITRHGDEPTTVYTTGVGCTHFGKTICEKINVKLEQLTEFDCFVKAFVYLAKLLPRTELLQPFIEEAVTEPLESVKSQVSVMNETKNENLTQSANFDMAGWLQGLEMAVGRPSAAALTAGDVALSEAEPDIFPCLLAMCGSAVGFIKIERDGSFNVVDGSSRGGKAFFGLGKILTKCKTYEELMDLASQGDLRGVNVFTDELFHSPDSVESDDSIYKKSGNALPGLIFSFGKAADSDTMDFKREDLARGWLHYILLDLVQCAQYCCSKHDIKRLFFSGSLCNHPLVRHIITTESVRRNLFQLALSSPGIVQFDFIKTGAYLGALGCVINDIEKSAGK